LAGFRLKKGTSDLLKYNRIPYIKRTRGRIARQIQPAYFALSLPPLQLQLQQHACPCVDVLCGYRTCCSVLRVCARLTGGGRRSVRCDRHNLRRRNLCLQLLKRTICYSNHLWAAPFTPAAFYPQLTRAARRVQSVLCDQLFNQPLKSQFLIRNISFHHAGTR